MRKLLIASLALLASAGCRTASLGGHPMFHGPRQQVDLWDIDWRVKLVEPGLLEYQPRELATPAFDPDTDRVYALTRDRRVRAISPKGKVEWEFVTDGPFNAGATVADNVVYVPGADGFLYALRGRTGEVVWKYEAKEELATSPVVDGDRILVASMTDTLFAVNKETGVWTWQYRRDTPAGFTIRGAAAPVVAGGRVYMGFSDGYFVALSAEDGTLEWERQLGSGKEFLDVDTTAVVNEINGRVYVASYSGGIFGLDAQTGDVLWNTTATGITHLVSDGARVFATGNGRVSAYDVETGALTWTQPLKDSVAREPVLARDHLIVPLDASLLFLDPKTGRQTVAWDPGNGVSAAPLPRGAHLYVLSNLGFLYAMYLTPPAQG